MKSNKSLIRFMRNWHRDIGYFTVFVTIIYALSGIFLTHKDAFPVISTHETYIDFPAGLSMGEFSNQWEIKHPDLSLSKCFIKNENVQFYYKGGKGKYNTAQGQISIESYKKHGLIAFVNQLHLNQIKGWKYMANFFALSLIFLAISGLVMVKGKNGFRKRGIWLMLSGIFTVIIFLFI